MRISNDGIYKSLAPFAAIDLPSFAVLIGPNGSGKSQFLEAMLAGSIRSDLFGDIGVGSIPHGSALLLANGEPKNLFEESVASYALAGNGPWATPKMFNEAHWDNQRTINLSDSTTQLADILTKSESKLRSLYGDPWSMDFEELAKIEGIEKSDRRHAQLKTLFESAEQKLVDIGPLATAFRDIAIAIKAVAGNRSISPLKVTFEDCEALHNWGSFNRFEPNLAIPISCYRDAQLKNDLARIADKRNGTTNCLSDDEFTEKFGPPPWETISDAIQSFGLAYSVVAPSTTELAAPYKFKLIWRDGSTIVEYPDLSSGEKVLLQFALSLFQYDPVRVAITQPKLLLLDEMDASLHPEMLNLWLSTIQNKLVEENGIVCILTTHSPITVALSPEESLYELSEGEGGPKKISKQSALNKLMSGVPALAVDYSGRRQVLVESDADAAIYQDLSNHLKSNLELPRSLTFIAAGRNGSGDGGCSSVIRLTDELSNSGNTSVLGLVDWDGSREPTGRVKVLAHGTHYAIENVLLNPLLVAAYLIKRDIKIEGFDLTFIQLAEAAETQLQKLADIIQNTIQYPKSANKDCNEVPYLGGFSLQIRTDYNMMQGHALEAALTRAFPALPDSVKAGAGHTVFQVVSKVIPELPNFCPTVMGNTLTELASAEI